MGSSEFYFQAVRMHLELTGLMSRIALLMVSYDATHRALIDCLTLCLSDLEQAIATNDGCYPAFSESTYRKVRDYETNKDWFHNTYAYVRYAEDDIPLH